MCELFATHSRRKFRTYTPKSFVEYKSSLKKIIKGPLLNVREGKKYNRSMMLGANNTTRLNKTTEWASRLDQTNKIALEKKNN